MIDQEAVKRKIRELNNTISKPEIANNYNTISLINENFEQQHLKIRNR